MVFLDTHALIRLALKTSKIPTKIWKFLDSQDLVISPMARLELEFLSEIGRIKEDPTVLFQTMVHRTNLRVEESGWARAAEVAAVLNWTRDPFDRLITAHALVWAAPLLTNDATIQARYAHAFWEDLPI